MKNDSLVIWQDTNLLYKEKCIHARKPGGKRHTGFAVFTGDVPVMVINEITKQAMPVVNIRGFAYACRKRVKYRKNKRNNMHK